MGFGPTLYSKRLYAGNDYSESPSLVLLADAIAEADSRTAAASAPRTDALTLTDSHTVIDTEVLADALALVDQIIVAGTIALSDAQPVADALSLLGVHLLSDALGLTDAFGAFFSASFHETMQVTENPTLLDFIRLKEFISLELRRSAAPVWTKGQTSPRSLVPHLYSQVLYGQAMYSTNLAQVWQAIKKSTGPGFTNFDGNKN